jgi:hypothetical protein
VNRENGVPLIVIATQHVPELEIGYPLPYGVDVPVNLGNETLVFGFFREFDEGAGIVQRSLERFPSVDPLIETADLQHHFLGGDIIVPEVCRFRLGLKRSYLTFLRIDVKDNLGVQSIVSAFP